VSGISREAMRALVNYDFPGNVRELENAVERAVIIASGRQIEIEDLPEAINKKVQEFRENARRDRILSATNGDSVKIEFEVPTSIDEIERQTIAATLDFTHGDKSRAAKLLGIGRKTLYRKLEQYEK
jgi:DNA-binding NtrC family response regulator